MEQKRGVYWLPGVVAVTIITAAAAVIPLAVSVVRDDAIYALIASAVLAAVAGVATAVAGVHAQQQDAIAAEARVRLVQLEAEVDTIRSRFTWTSHAAMRPVTEPSDYAELVKLAAESRSKTEAALREFAMALDAEEFERISRALAELRQLEALADFYRTGRPPE